MIHLPFIHYLFQCQEQCRHGFHGLACAEKCLCENGATCDPVDGYCACPDGWAGQLCAQRACADQQTYGPHCSLMCSCHPNNTEM